MTAHSAQLLGAVRASVDSILDKYLPEPATLGVGVEELEPVLENIYSDAYDDLLALSGRDPAAASPDSVLESSSSFRAVLSYRVAHGLLHAEDIDSDFIRSVLAERISGDAKAATGVDISPSSTIGRRFCLDHGANTVIGAQCEIGDDCYLLQGVILGAIAVGERIEGRRHPRLGNRVTVAGCARVFGPVTIGDDVFIAAYSVITQDVPSDARVVIVNQLQITRDKPGIGPEVFGVGPSSDGTLHVWGSQLEQLDRAVLDYGNGSPGPETANLQIVHSSDRLLRLVPDSSLGGFPNHDPSLVLSGGSQRVQITYSLGIRRFLESEAGGAS